MRIAAPERPYSALKSVPRDVVEAAVALDDLVGDTGDGPLEVGGLDFEFLDGVEWRENDKVCAVEEVDGVRVIVDAIEEVVIHRGALTIGGKSAAACVTTGIGLGGVYAYGNLSEKSKIAAVQRKAVHFLGVNDLTDGGILRLQQGGGGGDFDGLRYAARLERKILDYIGADIDSHTFGAGRLEAMVGDVNPVTANLDRGEFEDAVRTGGGREASARSLTDEGDLGTTEYGAALVGNCPQDGTGVQLSAERG